MGERGGRLSIEPCGMLMETVEVRCWLGRIGRTVAACRRGRSEPGAMAWLWDGVSSPCRSVRRAVWPVEEDAGIARR